MANSLHCVKDKSRGSAVPAAEDLEECCSSVRRGTGNIGPPPSSKDGALSRRERITARAARQRSESLTGGSFRRRAQGVNCASTSMILLVRGSM